MNDGPEWFAPKRYGYGSGLPIAWQGWAITAAFFLVTVAIMTKFREEPVAAVAAVIPFVVAYAVVASRTTRGGWRWRWGEKD